MRSICTNILSWIRQNRFVWCCVIGLALCRLLCGMLHPTVPIYINELTFDYLPAVGILSAACLLLPIIGYLCTDTFRELSWQEQVMSVGIVLMLGSIVFRPSVYLHVQLVFFATTVIALLFDKDRKWHRQPLFFYAAWLYVLWLAVSILWAPADACPARYLNRLMPLITYTAAFSVIHLSEQNYRLLVRTFWRIVCVACLLTVACGIYETQRMGIAFSEFLQFKKVLIKGLPVYDYLYAWSGTGHPSFNALWLMAGLVCGYYLRDKELISRFELLCGCLLVLFIVIITQSRVGSIMWLLVTVLGVLYLLRRNTYSLYSAMMVIACIVAAGIGTQWDALRTLYADPTRVQLLQVATDYIHTNPWYGSGLGGMTYAHLESVVGYEFHSWWPQYAEPMFYPHNQFIGDWMQAGIVGLLLSISLIGCGFYDAIRRRSFIAWAYMCALSLIMLIEMPFHFLGGTTIIAFFCCFIFSHRSAPARGTATDTPPCDSSTRTI